MPFLRRNRKAKKAMKLAWKLYKSGKARTWSSALRKAWRKVNGKKRRRRR